MPSGKATDKVTPKDINGEEVEVGMKLIRQEVVEVVSVYDEGKIKVKFPGGGTLMAQSDQYLIQ